MTGANLAHALQVLTVPDCWRRLGLPGNPGRSCRSPFREDKHPSFSVSENGKTWFDHAAGEGGGVVDFVMRARNCSKAEAAQWCVDQVALPVGHSPAIPTAPRPTPQPPKPRPGRMDAETARVWREGIDHLSGNAELCAGIDSWRGYRPGTVATLAEGGVMGAPLVYGRRTIAFVVADRDAVELGFHARHCPRDGERARWSFHPTGTPSLPFVLGGGFAPYARRVLVTEGQWDVIAAASALGWLAHDTSWDEHTVFLGARGVGGFSSVSSEWLHVIPESAEWFLYRDADKAGESWKGYAEQLAKDGRKVHLRRPAAGKDLNDVLRGRSVTAGELLQ